MSGKKERKTSADAKSPSTAPIRTSPESVVIQKTLSLSQSSDGNVLIPQISLGASLDVGNSDRVDGTFDFSRRESLSGGNHLSADLRERFQLEKIAIQGRLLTSSATAVVPSSPKSREAFNCDFARSTST